MTSSNRWGNKASLKVVVEEAVVALKTNRGRAAVGKVARARIDAAFRDGVAGRFT